MGEGVVSRLWPEGPAEFVAIQKAAYRAIKAVDPEAIASSRRWLRPASASSRGPNRSRALDDRVFLEHVYRASDGDIRRYFDVLGVHSYGYNNPPGDWLGHQTVATAGFKSHPSFYFRRFTQLRDVLLAYGDDKPLWITELGWTSCRLPAPGHEFCLDNSEAQRARYLVEGGRDAGDTVSLHPGSLPSGT